MPKSQRKEDGMVRHSAPAMTIEAREAQLIAKAIDLAEKQLDEGTASSQVISHFLQLGSTRAKYEMEKLKLENKLISAKADDISMSRHSEEMYTNAIKAMQIYQGVYNGDKDAAD